MHPEVAFWALNGRQPLRSPKKRTAGIEERLRILEVHYPRARECFDACSAKYLRKRVARDDIVDAIAGAVTARFAPHLATLPADPPLDDEGLPMEIVYAAIASETSNPRR